MEKMKLLCIPPSACSAMMYLQWKTYFPEQVEIVPVELPGKGTKFREKLCSSIDEITNSLVDEVIEKTADDNYSVFGFCSGAVVAFDLVQKLAQKGFRPAAHFIGASSRDPSAQIHAPSALDVSDEMLVKIVMNIFKFKVNDKNDEDYMCRFIANLHPKSGETLSGMSDDEFLAAIKEDNEEGRRAMESLRRTVEMLKTDSAILHSYHVPETVRPMEMPVTMIHGKYDNLVKRSEVAEWKKYCASAFEIRMIAGGHLAAFDNSADTAAIIKETIL